MSPSDPLASNLAEIRESLDLPPGVVLAVLRLPTLDPLIDRLESRVGRGGSGSSPDLDPAIVAEIERTVELLSGFSLGAVPDAIARRVRLVEVLRIAAGGRLPSIAFDNGDAFGAELRTILETDTELCATLGRLHPLIIRATSVAPTERWVAAARMALARDEADVVRNAVGRVLATLLRAAVNSRPDVLVGGVRLANQRMARGLLWVTSVADHAPADLLGAIGIRMGTSGRNDAVVRDTALANTCAALLGASNDPHAAMALASMRVRITNRNVLKQVDRALGVIAARQGVPVGTVIDLALPTFGLDASSHLERIVGPARAVIALGSGGEVAAEWFLPGGGLVPSVPTDIATSHPGEVASIAELAALIRSTLAEERVRMDERLGSEREWPAPAWQARFRDHPIGGLFGRRLIWILRTAESGSVEGLPDGERWLAIDGRHLDPDQVSGVAVRLWHPVDADEAGIAAWQAMLAITGVRQPIRQADREVFRPADRDRDLAVDRRFAGRVVDHAQLRALLRQRGWSVPALGAWDQGDEATAWRQFDGGLRAQLRYQAVELVPTGSRHERARLVAVRFGAVGADESRGPVEIVPAGSLAAIPPRAFSEALRDVSLAVAVGQRDP